MTLPASKGCNQSLVPNDTLHVLSCLILSTTPAGALLLVPPSGTENRSASPRVQRPSLGEVRIRTQNPLAPRCWLCPLPGRARRRGHEALRGTHQMWVLACWTSGVTRARGWPREGEKLGPDVWIEPQRPCGPRLLSLWTPPSLTGRFCSVVGDSQPARSISEQPRWTRTVPPATHGCPFSPPEPNRFCFYVT